MNGCRMNEWVYFFKVLKGFIRTTLVDCGGWMGKGGVGSDVWKESTIVNRSSCLGSLYFP